MKLSGKTHRCDHCGKPVIDHEMVFGKGNEHFHPECIKADPNILERRKELKRQVARLEGLLIYEQRQNAFLKREVKEREGEVRRILGAMGRRRDLWFESGWIEPPPKTKR